MGDFTYCDYCMSDRMDGFEVSQKFGNSELVDIKSQLSELTETFKKMLNQTEGQHSSVEPRYIS